MPSLFWLFLSFRTYNHDRSGIVWLHCAVKLSIYKLTIYQFIMLTRYSSTKDDMECDTVVEFSLYKDKATNQKVSQWFERKTSKMFKLAVITLLFGLASAQNDGTWRQPIDDARCPQRNGVFADIFHRDCHNFIICNDGHACKFF